MYTQLILKRNKNLKVKKVHTQHNIKSLQGRSVRLDIFATDNLRLTDADKAEIKSSTSPHTNLEI